MIVFRLSKAKYAKDLSGKGAEKAGARWNSKGVSMLYTSESIALCTIEIAVHTPLGNIPSDYNIVTIEIPDNSIFKVEISKLPTGWKSSFHPRSTQKMGDNFIDDGKFLVMKVPSVALQGAYNFVLNPKHTYFEKVKILQIESFTFDERLFRK